ncbi:MAG: hypothetical protein KDD69_13825 [Bdellovibrionales bacterium]|nr:hypothetical protein [Bdellovibrionales bacterium]
MKNKLLPFLHFVVVFFLFTASTVVADNDKSQAPTPPPDNSSAELKRIKALEGRWKSTTSMFGKENEEVFTEYKITAGGSAVVETIFPGTPNEMVSVYYDNDEGKLAMTHYCMMRNRPHFTLVESSDDVLKLDVTKVEGVKSDDAPSMGAITLNFKDQNHFSSTCEARGGDAKEHHEPMTMQFTRIQ